MILIVNCFQFASSLSQAPPKILGPFFLYYCFIYVLINTFKVCRCAVLTGTLKRLFFTQTLKQTGE